MASALVRSPAISYFSAASMAARIATSSGPVATMARSADGDSVPSSAVRSQATSAGIMTTATTARHERPDGKTRERDQAIMMARIMTTATPTLPKSYSPAEAEDAVRQRWDASGAFHAEPDETVRSKRSAYCILIPPPNVTAALHLGHAFNNTLQDVLVRYHRMRGFNTLWMPGTDHAGIATQTVVEKRLLQQEGKRRTEYDRDEFVAKVQAWKDEYEATITGQLKGLGCSCDWERQRFTMDPICAKAVREAFFRLFREGLIYRGKRLVNWDPVTLTALADDEVEMKEVQGRMWYLRYPLVAPVTIDGRTVDDLTVATTRPETMLGDTAVAMNPRDPRASALSGARVRLPIVGRVVPIIEDDYVVLPSDLGGDPADAKSEFATGFLKVTPAHDPNDWEIGQRHGLAAINVMGPDASISDRDGWEDVSEEARSFLGLSREAARTAIVDWFKAHGLLEEVREYRHSVGHSYRSHVPIEPYLSDQWYVRVTDDSMKNEALRALDGEQYEGTAPQRTPTGTAAAARSGDGELRFYPARYARSFQAWHENLRDWCISRQLWWGHRIPVWSCDRPDLDPSDLSSEFRAAEGEAWAQTLVDGVRFVCLRDGGDRPLAGALEEAGFRQDQDVLDTWFSSALWPLSTMGWPQPRDFPETLGLLETFNPSSVLCTGRDIITLWVSRMVMFNRHFRDGQVPFHHVYINPMIQDGHGQRMSKSLGNGVDPRDIIHSHGADAARFTLVQMATSTQDSRMPVDMVCPHCEHRFHPAEATSPAGYRVAAPVQSCSRCHKEMVSGYGAASGTTPPSGERPLARNTSSKFDEGRNFANKVWNATRFALQNLSLDAVEGPPRDRWSSELDLVDRWIVSRLHQSLHVIEDALADYQFSVYADAIYQFVWRDFCDWYLEAIKPTVRTRAVQQQVLRTVLNAITRLLHPICPFVTEYLWPSVQASGAAGLDGISLPSAELLAAAPWPDIECRVHDGPALEEFARVQALVEAIRAVRGDLNVPPRRKIALHVPPDLEPLVEASRDVIAALAGLDRIDGMPEPRPSDAVSIAVEGRELLLANLSDAVDLDAQRARLQKVVAEKERAVEAFRSKLANPNYLAKAPPAVVEETKAKLQDAEADLEAARRALAGN